MFVERGCAPFKGRNNFAESQPNFETRTNATGNQDVDLVVEGRIMYSVAARRRT